MAGHGLQLRDSVMVINYLLEQQVRDTVSYFSNLPVPITLNGNVSFVSHQNSTLLQLQH